MSTTAALASGQKWPGIPAEGGSALSRISDFNVSSGDPSPSQGCEGAQTVAWDYFNGLQSIIDRGISLCGGTRGVGERPSDRIFILRISYV